MKLFYTAFAAIALASGAASASIPDVWQPRVDMSQRIQRARTLKALQQPAGAPRANDNDVPNVPAEGDIKIPVLLVEFTDLSFSVAANPLEDFTQHCNGETGSVARYYRDASENKFRPQYDLYGPKRLAHSHDYYGTNNSWGYDKRLGELCSEATALFNSDVDFSQYDNDADGICDAVIILFAGPCDDGYDDPGHYLGACHFDMASSEIGHTVERDGVEIAAFAIFNEQALDLETSQPTNRMEGIGSFVHEFGHCMGLPDLYQVETHPEDDYAIYSGMGYWDVMSYGTYGGPDWDSTVPVGFSAYEKNFLGWMDIDAATDGNDYTLLPHNRETSWGLAGRALRITHPTDPNEYFIVENRQLEGQDYYLSDNDGNYLEEGGLLITHVIYDEEAWNYNELNDYEFQRMTVVQTPKKYYRLFPGKETAGTYSSPEWTSTSNPKAKWSDGTLLDTPLTDIRRNDDGTVSFHFGAPAGVEDVMSDGDANSLASQVVINGSSLTVPIGAQVHNIAGIRISSSSPTLYNGLPAGIYIVSLQGEAVKVAIR